MSTRTRGVALSGVLVCVGVLTACGGPVTIDSSDLEGAELAQCEAFLDALPATLNDEEPRDVEPTDALGAAFGDPDIIVTCGVATPSGFNETSQCEEVNSVGWWAPPEQYDDQSVDVTLYAVSYSPVVELRVPADYRPDGVATALAELGAPVEGALELVKDCL